MYKITPNEKGYLNVFSNLTNKYIFPEGFDHKTTKLEIVKVNEKEKAIIAKTFVYSKDNNYEAISIYTLDGFKMAQAIDGHKRGEAQGNVEVIDKFKCNLQFENNYFYYHYKKSAIPIPKTHEPTDRSFVVFDYSGKVLFSEFDCANFKAGIKNFEDSKAKDTLIIEQ